MAPAAARPRLEEVGHVDAAVPEEVRRPLLAEELPREQRAQNLPDLAAGHAQPAGQVREALLLVVVEAYGENAMKMYVSRNRNAGETRRPTRA